MAVLTAVDGLKRVSTSTTVNVPFGAETPAPLPRASTTAFWPMNASVVFVMTGTAPAAPTLAEPETETLPTTTSRSVDSVAATLTLPSASMSAPSLSSGPPSMKARVVMS